MCDTRGLLVLQINMHNAGKVRAKIIAEGANGPVTPFAQVSRCLCCSRECALQRHARPLVPSQDILERNGSVILPDMLMNAGGVTGEGRASSVSRSDGCHTRLPAHAVSYFEWLKNLQHG